MVNRRNFDTLTPDIRVRINEKDLPETAKADLISITVTEDVGTASYFTITLLCWDGALMRVKWIDDELLREGNVVEILIGYKDNLESIIKGEITGLEPQFTNDEPPVLTVLGYDRGHRMMRKRKTMSFTQLKDSDIAAQIAGQYGFRSNITDTNIQLAYVLQHNQTDFEFLRQRAQRIGYELGVNDQTLYFRPRNNAGQEVLTLTREVELLEFYPRLSTIGQLENVTIQTWDPKTKDVVSSQIADAASLVNAANPGTGAVRKAFPNNSGGVSTDLAISSQSEADQIANAWFKEMALSYVTGEGLCIGTPKLRAGSLVSIEGLGARFSGRYYVTGTEHSYKPTKGYRTAFSFKRDATS
ncbi:MAG: phage late control D family protein [Methylococcaceae bacterium]|nr:phage late control D family protein [Methylococcaceae bacterium]